tara:strand:- start:122 stop:1078 length:957 start_codon:yes stop_codon:yes gene_type:complete
MMPKKDKIHLTILFGGISSEREVSIKSAMEILPILKKSYDVSLIELNKNNFPTFINNIKNNSLVFNTLHGGEGENGQIQSFLSQHNIPYTGSGPTASMLAMNKHFTKIIATENNINTPQWLIARLDSSYNFSNLFFKPKNKIKFPVVVKPNFQGSTLGLSIINNKNEMDDAVKLSSLFSNEIIIEKYIKGRELTIGILGNKVLDAVEIIPKTGFYDYESKYTKGKTNYISPAKIDKKIESLIKSNALKIYKALGCRHYARVDFMLDENNVLYLLELNSLPGLCSTSLLPMSAKSAGVNFKELLDIIINISLIDKGSSF